MGVVLVVAVAWAWVGDCGGGQGQCCGEESAECWCHLGRECWYCCVGRCATVSSFWTAVLLRQKMCNKVKSLDRNICLLPSRRRRR